MSLLKEEQKRCDKWFFAWMSSKETVERIWEAAIDAKDEDRELAVKRAVIATDKLHAAGLQAKDKKIKKLCAEIDTYRLRIIRLREAFNVCSQGQT